ncbi:MAG: methyltransferase domain-containing protein [Azoarcus sp.]|jgi:2-polyprenyl-3-methyl-5-hydroxy-6-metoxy-1,4-benzoquinol methylase|nr:methyltransferase domain-containing protein [Azoarcus sp.]
MQRDEVVHLQIRTREISDPVSYILQAAIGRRVLNVGAGGGVERYLPEHRDLWLHARLRNVAAEVTGIDIDHDSIEFASRHGVKIDYGDCENVCFDHPFDLIVMSDVIEHVNAPLYAISNLARQLSPQGRLLITTPNLTHYGMIGKAWFGKNTSVYYDHVMGFLPEHFQAISNRLGLSLTDIAFFSHIDSRSMLNRYKSLLSRFIGKLIPRAHSSLLVILESQERTCYPKP